MGWDFTRALHRIQRQCAADADEIRDLSRYVLDLPTNVEPWQRRFLEVLCELGPDEELRLVPGRHGPRLVAVTRGELRPPRLL